MLYGGVLSLPKEQREMMNVIWRGAFIATRTGGDDGCYMEGCFHCHKNRGRCWMLCGGVLSLPKEQGGDDGCYMEGYFHCHKNRGK
jgi:hypothetical protein